MRIPLFLFILCALALAACKGAKTRSEQPVTYQEQHRPQIHFSPQRHWMNDPNGMFFYEGEYHLCYQYYPDSNVWGPMHWGHAVSKDLLHWQHLPIALYPDKLGYIFSGSAVVDWKNTSGFGQGGKPPIVAMFTYHDMKGEKEGRSNFQYQGLAYSNDRGRSWKKYAKNPVIPNTENIRDFRDTKVIWHEASQQWVMVLAAQNHLKFWASKDLKVWSHLSDFGQNYGAHGGVWECPDLFPMKVEGSGENKWVLLSSINPGGPNGGSATQYFVGDFDGKTFSIDASFAPLVQNGKALWLDHGRDNYAGVTWSDIPQSDGRRLFMGWMSNWDYAQTVPTQLWRSAMTLPRSLHLHKAAVGYRLHANPVTELKSLRGKAQNIEDRSTSTPLELNDVIDFSTKAIEIELEVEIFGRNLPEFGIELYNAKKESYRVGFNAASNQFFSDRTAAGKRDFSEKFAPQYHLAPRESREKNVKMHLFIDAASAELFTDGGAICMTDIFFPNAPFDKARFFVQRGKVRIVKASFYLLDGVWK